MKKLSFKKEWKRFSKALTENKLPKNATTTKLLKYFGKRGKPLKRELRSRKNIEEFNRLLTAYNKERPTIAKEEAKRKAIREKQIETRRKNVSPRRAKNAVAKYEKILDIIESVHDDIGAYISYEEVEEIYSNNKKMDANKISEFIVDHYKEMQDSLPDFAKDDTSLDGVMPELKKTMKEIKSYNIDDIEKALQLKASNPARYAKKYKIGTARKK